MTPAALEYRHRIEEVGERFGFAFAAQEGVSQLPFSALARVRHEGARVTHSVLRAWADEAGVPVVNESLWLAWEGAVEDLEDALLRFFEQVVQSDPRLYLARPARRIEIPADGSLPQSKTWLDRFYGDDFLPREKKPAVVDLARCQGPYLRSIDDDPLQIVDAASQIASLAAGFRPDAVQSALDEGRFDPYLLAAPDLDSAEAGDVGEAFRAALLEVAPPGLDFVTFTNGGAEANEKALHLAVRNGRGGKRLVAFEGSFHGRTLLSLFSTWNPSKRAPYQLPGFEAVFLPFPHDPDPYADPLLPVGWRAAWTDRDGQRAWPGSGDAVADATLAAEVETLCALERELQADDVLAVWIEPYQCEGGDRSATRRFFHALRALTRGYDVPLIFDEVQSGFGLSGSPFWHQRFKLIDAAGRPDGPDVVTGAKRAQTGYVISRWPDPTPTPTHAASMVRGLTHMELLRRQPGHSVVARARLEALALKWPDLISRPRVFGDAFAFDLPSGEAANHLIGQRFYRGYMVYIAGERTLRYRLNRGMTATDVDAIFGVIDRSVEALVEQAGGLGPDLAERTKACKPPEWSAPAPIKAVRKERPTITLVRLDREAFDRHHDAINAIEAEAYEPARRDNLGYLRTLVETEGSVCFVAKDAEGVVGVSFAAPIELWPGLDGPRQDPHRGRGDTLYSADLTVAERARGQGVGLLMREAFLSAALRERDADGQPRYAYVTGRNRAGAAEAMWRLNRRFGAYEVARYLGQYGEPEAVARYYRVPLRRFDRRQAEVAPPILAPVDFAQGVNMPVGSAHPLLERARALGVFDEAALTKLTVSNFITRPYARYAEYLQRVAPAGNPHLYFTSCNDEMVDKSIRALKHNRSESHVAVGLSGGYLGGTTAAARSLSDGADNFFEWPIVRHPQGQSGADAATTVAELDALVAKHGADALIGVFVEAVQARTGATLDADSWGALCAWRDRTGVPLVLVENTTGFGRHGAGFWWVDSVEGDADIVLWWAGGQIGHVFSSPKVYVSKPLTLISTWDGDELSATRLLWSMYATRGADSSAAAADLEAALLAVFEPECVGGRGLYRTVTLDAERAISVQAGLAECDIAVGRHGGVLVFSPSLLVSTEAIAELAQELVEVTG